MKNNKYLLDDLMLLPILIVNWSLWAVSGFHKLYKTINGDIWISPQGWIPWLKGHFLGTILDGYVEPLFFILTALELFAGILLTIAFFRLEFLSSRGKFCFKLGLFFGALCIAVMSFGQNIANADEDVFRLSSYLSTTLMSYLFVLLYPSYNSSR
mgnify:CR=1 FL=1